VFAFCPNQTEAGTTDVPGATNEGTIPCDTCTGAPFDGWHVVAWQTHVSGVLDEQCWCNYHHEKHCGRPGPGCNSTACIEATDSDPQE
jgi:hypothetical protein